MTQNQHDTNQHGTKPVWHKMNRAKINMAQNQHSTQSARMVWVSGINSPKIA